MRFPQRRRAGRGESTAAQESRKLEIRPTSRSSSDGVVWHSQMTNARHPSSLSARTDRRSRVTLPSNFDLQNSWELDGKDLPFEHSECLCQKHP